MPQFPTERDAAALEALAEHEAAPDPHDQYELRNRRVTGTLYDQATGSLLRKTYDDGTVDDRAYDAFGRLDVRTVTRPNLPQLKLRSVYDAAGNLVREDVVP